MHGLMADPYKIDPPACISFSGGRSSGYMLHKVLQAHGGQLPEGVYVVFANTGKEHEATLDFIRDCSEYWDVPIHWVEWCITGGEWGERERNAPGGGKQMVRVLIGGRAGYREVTHATASRKGEPFADWVIARNNLPNATRRKCTAELKVARINQFMRDRVGHSDSDHIVGIRYDENNRWRRNANREQLAMPLVDAKVDLNEVLTFWRKQNFDLQLPVTSGHTLLGNCDLCFMKGKTKLRRVMAENPDLHKWWSDLEKAVAPQMDKDGVFGHSTFFYDMTYERLQQQADKMAKQPDMFNEGVEELIPLSEVEGCYCGD